MKTAIDKNESELEKMKRESLEWIERYGKSAPPFISVAINAFASQSQSMDERSLVKHFLVWYNTTIRERHFDDEHIEYVLDEYFTMTEQENLTTAEKEEINAGYRSLDPLFEGFEQEKQTAEEILYFQVNEAYLDECGIKDCVLNAMEEYASQRQSLPTDEEIDAFYPIESEHTALTMGFIEKNKARREGAKWFKSQLKQGCNKVDNVKDK